MNKVFRLLPYLFIISTFLLSSMQAYSRSCEKALDEMDFSKNPLVAQLNSRLADPEYKVLILGRHGKASQKNKFTAEEREADPKKVALDIKRPLADKGREAARRLSNLMGQLDFRKTGMWGSHALRVQETAKPSIKVLGKRVKVTEFDPSLYYADIPYEMNKRLTSKSGKNIPHAFFWGHGKTTFALFKHLTGTDDGFLPTAAIMVIALKADSWKQVFKGKSKQVEAYAWSPNNSHYIEGGDTPLSSLESAAESFGGLESVPQRESVAVEDDIYQGFEFFVIVNEED